MKQFKLTSAVLVLSFATPIFAVQANDTAATNDEKKRHRFYRILSLIFMVLYARLSA